METLDSWKQRSELLLGAEGLSRLANARVMVIGIGGVGSSCAEALVRGGVGHLVFVDGDVVQPSNLNRQAIAFVGTLGRDKVEVMADMAHAINPAADVTACKRVVLSDDVEGLLDEHPVDFVVDCQDTVATKIALAASCERRGIALVSSMGAGNRFDPTQLAFSDIYETSVCPLCRVVRKRARAAGIGHLRVLYSREPLPDLSAARASAVAGEHPPIGTMSYLPPIMGQMLAADVICTLAHVPWKRG